MGPNQQNLQYEVLANLMTSESSDALLINWSTRDFNVIATHLELELEMPFQTIHIEHRFQKSMLPGISGLSISLTESLAALQMALSAVRPSDQRNAILFFNHKQPDLSKLSHLNHPLLWVPANVIMRYQDEV